MLYRSVLATAAGGFAVVALLAFLGFAAPSAQAAPPSPLSGAVSFTEDILPIFERSCTGCHGGVDADGNKRAEEDLDLTTYEGVMAGSAYGTVVEPGDADASILIEMVSNGDMPSQDDGPMDPLSAEEIELIKTWINEGANNG